MRILLAFLLVLILFRMIRFGFRIVLGIIEIVIIFFIIVLLVGFL